MQHEHLSTSIKPIRSLVNSPSVKAAQRWAAYGNRFQIQRLNKLTRCARNISNSRAVRLSTALSQRGNKLITLMKNSSTRSQTNSVILRSR